ncbi:hypothetical protein [Methanoregula sp.]|uniref:hypothetical protein n=1 Tax=Methanoregula sp. TaxID=2052170 RepID=UPI003566BE49
MKIPDFTQIKRMFSGWKLTGLVLLLYVVFTVILTYPVAFTIGTDIPSWGGDAFQWMDTLWYTNYAIFHPEITTLTHNNMIYYPTGIPVTPFPSAFNQIITLVLLPICQIHVIYSLLWLLTFILAAFGTYLLVRYLTHNDYAAFLAGIIFAFIPYHLLHGMGHLGAATIQWIPFCALFFMKVFREGGIKNCILAGIFYILVAMSDTQYMVFMGIFIVLLFIYENYVNISSNRGFKFEAHKSILIKYLIIGVVAFSVILPLTMSDIQVASSEGNYLKPNATEVVTYSTDLMSFFLPSVLHPVFGGLVEPVNQNFTGNAAENATYIGYTVLLLSIFGLYVFRKDITARFWGLIAIIFSLLSMGPVLHVNGETVFTVFKISVPLPHLILYYLVPFIENSRTTGRFFIVAALAFAVLAGYGCSELLKRYDTKKIIIVIILCAFILFEYLGVPYPTSPIDPSAFYQKIGQDPDHYALLEIPVTDNYTAGVNIIYYQTIHGKAIVGGQSARTLKTAYYFEPNTQFIRDLTFNLSVPQDIVNQNDTDVGNSILHYYNIRYIILHKNYLSEDQLQATESYLAQCNPLLPKVYEDDSLVVYGQNQTVQNDTGVVLGTGWNRIENYAGTPSRWISNNASILVYSDNARFTWLNFTAISFAKERPISIALNNVSIGSYLIAPSYSNLSIPIEINKGMNSLDIINQEGCERPVDNASYNSMDTRCLGIALQNISIPLSIE